MSNPAAPDPSVQPGAKVPPPIDPDVPNPFGPDAPNVRDDDSEKSESVPLADPPSPSRTVLDEGDFAPDED